MDQQQLQVLLDRAGEHYNNGEYAEAIAIWKQILAADPDNKTANERIRMAEMLSNAELDTGQRRVVGKSSSPLSAEVKERIRAGIARVRELATEGKYDEAGEGCTLLEKIAPQDSTVRRLRDEINALAAGKAPEGPAGDPEEILKTAREALEAGRNDEAARAASLVLKLDPANMEACGILSMAGGGPGGAEPVEIGEARESEPELVDEPIPLDDLIEPSAAEVAADPDDRIEALLAEGKEAFDQGHYQDAVEIWSRVYAIDQSHAVAGELIDKARGIMEEQGRQVDDLFGQAVAAHEAGRLEEALGLLQQVRSMSPTHAEALTYIEEINARLAGESEPISLDTEAAKEVEGERGKDFPEKETLYDEPSVPLALDDEPAPAAAPAGEEREMPHTEAVSSPAGGGHRPLMTVVAGAILAGAVGIGAYLWFGNDGSIAEAEAGTDAGRAPAVAENPAPGDPTGSPGGGPIGVLPGTTTGGEGPSIPTDPVERKRLVARYAREGREHFRRQDWAAAVMALREVRRLDPTFDMGDMLERAMQELEREAEFEQEMARAAQFFLEQDFASSLHKLYRLQQKFPDKRPFDLYIKNAWFNWGAFMMRAGAVDEAIEKFDEVLDIDPRDRGAQRAREFAVKYLNRSRDGAFDLFVESLPDRDIDQE